MWDDRGYPPVRFEYRTDSDGYTVAEIFAEWVWVYFAIVENLQFANFCEIHPKLFCSYLSNCASVRDHSVFKTNGRIFSIISYKEHSCGFCTSRDKTATRMVHFGKQEKTPNFGCLVNTHGKDFWTWFLCFRGSHYMNEDRLFEFWRYSISTKIESS